MASLIKSLEGIEITEDEKSTVLRGIANNNIWCLPYYNNISNIDKLSKVLKALYKVVEVCRLYGHSIVAVPTINFAKVAYVQNPWIDSGNYIEAVASADLVIAEGVYPDRQNNLEDWKMLELAFGRRLANKYRPSVFLDSEFKNLPVVGQALAAKAVLEKAKESEEEDAES